VDTLEDLLPSLDDDSYAAMVDLRAALVTDLTTRASSLPQLLDYTPNVTVPSLLVAQRLYGDATRADEIVLRNDVARPGFLPGGQALEVLNA
jgi:prophage DNA circulation protein